MIILARTSRVSNVRMYRRVGRVGVGVGRCRCRGMRAVYIVYNDKEIMGRVHPVIDRTIPS